MIKAILLDVDGVIVGERIGFNSPWPNKKVIDALIKIKNSGIPIVLVTAKPHYSVSKIIQDAKLDNLHITDGGAVVIDQINNQIVTEENIDKDIAKQILDTLIKNNVYTEFYTVSDYFIQNNQVSDLTKTHAHVLQKEPVVVESIKNTAGLSKITKIMPVAVNEADKVRVSKLLYNFEKDVKISWGIHPIALPHQFGIITSTSVSKKISAVNVVKEMNIDFTEVIGIGDSVSDWQFMELCGYVGVMGNAQDELKKIASSKGDRHFNIGGSVDDNGILDIFSYFKLNYF